MSYVPPHLRNNVQQPREKSATPSNASSSRHSPNNAGTSQRTPNTRTSNGLSTSRYAQLSATPSPSRISRRHDSAFALESDPNDIKPRRNIQENGMTGSSSGGSGKGLLTDMELIGTVSRSGGLGDENDAYVRQAVFPFIGFHCSWGFVLVSRISISKKSTELGYRRK
jgi:hypothetical protein